MLPAVKGEILELFSVSVCSMGLTLAYYKTQCNRPRAFDRVDIQFLPWSSDRYALEGVGGGGFFTMIHRTVDFTAPLTMLYVTFLAPFLIRHSRL